jgi:two-component system, NtrC family, nitrogen regulation sensor histidine kinase NtrY
MALVGFMVALILGTIISLGITRPIGALVRSARLIGHGNLLEAVTDVRSTDELGLLANTFNRMIGELREYHERLAMSERVAAWREIAQHIAHEIKNSLSPIQLSIENLRRFHEQDRGSFDEFFPECSETILEEVDKLRRLANEFSEFARLPKPVFENLDIAEIIDNVLSLHQPVAPKIAMRVERDESGPLIVRGDRDQLNRVFTNLVKNAIEAMNDGGELRVLERRVMEEIFIVIEDTGVGINREDMTRIFTPYFTSKSGGSGLGLSIVLRILKDHGASIDVYSDRETGTKFIIAFRAAPTSEEERGAPV